MWMNVKVVLVRTMENVSMFLAALDANVHKDLLASFVTKVSVLTHRHVCCYSLLLIC